MILILKGGAVKSWDLAQIWTIWIEGGVGKKFRALKVQPVGWRVSMCEWCVCVGQSRREFGQLGFKKKDVGGGVGKCNSSLLVLPLHPFPRPNPIPLLPATVRSVSLSTVMPELPLYYLFAVRPHQREAPGANVKSHSGEIHKCPPALPERI